METERLVGTVAWVMQNYVLEAGGAREEGKERERMEKKKRKRVGLGTAEKRKSWRRQGQ